MVYGCHRGSFFPQKLKFNRLKRVGASYATTQVGAHSGRVTETPMQLDS